MPIRNYTSGQPPAKTMGEIQALLAENNAQSIMIDYVDQEPVAIMFLMMINQTPVQFRLTVEVEALLNAMKADKKVANSYCTIEQAKRTAWKNKLEWLQLQLAEIATGQAKMEQLLLGYAVTNDGSTVYNRLFNGDTKLLAGE